MSLVIVFSGAKSVQPVAVVESTPPTKATTLERVELSLPLVSRVLNFVTNLSGIALGTPYKNL